MQENMVLHKFSLLTGLIKFISRTIKWREAYLQIPCSSRLFHWLLAFIPARLLQEAIKRHQALLDEMEKEEKSKH